MPICPRCNTAIHAGAETQCPACGYSLLRANAIFGDQEVLFQRVLDRAGVLTHMERQELVKALEDMERNLPPIALCIYITNDGRSQDMRAHAHWVLNHAHIHHPSFGRREKMRAIEDADFNELRPGEERETPPAKRTGWWQRLRASLRDIMHPYPPPVRSEWMLILVLDVQLEVACFSWGYMLDPYINPDSINSCIRSARLQFRERAMVVGLKKVMKAAVSRIAAQSHAVNRRMRRSAQAGALVLLAGAMALSVPAPLPAQAPAAPAAATPWSEDELAEEAEDDAAPAPAAATPAPASQVTDSGTAATAGGAPRWSAADYRHLLSGEFQGAYKMLHSAPSAAPARMPAAAGPRPAPESDTKVPKHYYSEYARATKSGLIDPQHLLSSVRREDVEYTLRTLNAHSPYRLYLAVFKQGQELPLELAVGSLVRSVAQPGEYAAMILYGLGDSPQVELGYHEISLPEQERLAWLERVRSAALQRGGGGIEGLLAAAHELHACLAPVAEQLPPLTRQSAVHVPLIPLQMREETDAEEPTFKDNLRLLLANPAVQPVLMWVLGILGALGLLGAIIWLHRRSGRLYKTQPDIRLASPSGAGVSRNVRYLEGKNM